MERVFEPPPVLDDRANARIIFAARSVDLVRTYGSGANVVRAVDGISLELAANRFTAIMGPSGSGKSTLLYCLAGLERPTAGQVWIGDVELSTLSERRLTRLRRDHVGFVFQAYNLVPTLTAEENILLPTDIAHRPVQRAWFDTIVDTLELRPRLGHFPAELSGGQQQRVAAARALMGRPEIIFADEPSGNLDSKAGKELLSFMQRSVQELGQTIVMVTHDPIIASYADRVVFLRDGRVVSEVSSPTPNRLTERMTALEA
jgi:putative ABC transport system ATP-binding protein